MTEHIGETPPAPPIPLQKYSRKALSLPEPTHRLLDHIATMRGMSMAGIVYLLARRELSTLAIDNAWSAVPSPFAIRANWFAPGRLVNLWTPFFEAAILTRREATQLADALTAFADGEAAHFSITTAFRAQRLRLQRGSHHITLHVNSGSYAVTREIAREVAVALDNASVGTLEQVAPEAIQRAA